ncbi:MAG: TVP38/TMEM64 family protein [Nitrospirota bacterium]
MTGSGRLRNSIWLKLFILITFFVTVLVLYASGAFHFFLDRNRLESFLNTLGPFSWFGFIALQLLQVVAAPIPGEVTGFLGGYLYGGFLGIILSTLGLTLGSWLAFFFSKTFGRPFVEKFVQKRTIERYDYLLKHRKAEVLVFILFLIPGFPKDYLCYILGLGPMATGEFLIISTVGRLMGTVMLTLGGIFFRNQQYYQFSMLVGIAIVIVLLSMAYRDTLEKFLRKWHR